MDFDCVGGFIEVCTVAGIVGEAICFMFSVTFQPDDAFNIVRGKVTNTFWAFEISFQVEASERVGVVVSLPFFDVRKRVSLWFEIM